MSFVGLILQASSEAREQHDLCKPTELRPTNKWPKSLSLSLFSVRSREELALAKNNPIPLVMISTRVARRHSIGHHQLGGKTLASRPSFASEPKLAHHYVHPAIGRDCCCCCCPLLLLLDKTRPALNDDSARTNNTCALLSKS